MKNGNKMKDNCPTVFPYYGGKYILSRKLVPMLHRHTRYVEVFFGGGSMFFRKNKAKINILNDLLKKKQVEIDYVVDFVPRLFCRKLYNYSYEVADEF